MPPVTKDKLVEEVGDWIDSYVIANSIVQAFVNNFGFPPTVEQCREVWLRTLDVLGDQIEKSASAVQVPDEQWDALWMT